MSVGGQVGVYLSRSLTWKRLGSKSTSSAGLIQSDHRVKAAAVVLPFLAVRLSLDQLTLSWFPPQLNQDNLILAALRCFVSAASASCRCTFSDHCVLGLLPPPHFRLCLVESCMTPITKNNNNFLLWTRDFFYTSVAPKLTNKWNLSKGCHVKLKPLVYGLWQWKSDQHLSDCIHDSKTLRTILVLWQSEVAPLTFKGSFGATRGSESSFTTALSWMCVDLNSSPPPNTWHQCIINFLFLIWKITYINLCTQPYLTKT